MTEHPHLTLNRCAVFLRYKQPFIDWLNTADPAHCSLTLEEINNGDGEVFLIPDDNSLIEPVEIDKDAVRWVEKRWRIFFEHILGDWLTDESLWPKKLSLKMFRDWFAVEYRSMVWDMGYDPLVLEDWDEDDDITINDTIH